MPVSISHENLGWRDFGLCTGQQGLLNLFFEHRCSGRCKRKTKRNGAACERDVSVVIAKEMCADCPALAHCRWWSIMTYQNDGVSGGLTSSQRVTIRRNMRRTQKGREILAITKAEEDVI